MVKNKKGGFTIVELLIVIVVIGILAAITVVAYNGIQTRATNSAIKSGATQFAKALQLWSAENDKTPLETGGGYNGTGYGWVSSQAVSPSYPTEVETVLRNAGYLPADFTSNLPKNTYQNSSSSTLMLYRCGLLADKYMLLYTLHSPSSQDIADFDKVKSTCSNAASIQTSYNMQGAIVF